MAGNASPRGENTPLLKDQRPVVTSNAYSSDEGRSSIVSWENSSDPRCPTNWSQSKKFATTVLYGITTMGVAFASSSFSPALPGIAAEFHVSIQQATVGLVVFLLGVGLGPLLWAPLSEIYGRKPAILIPYILSTLFTFATGLSPSLNMVFITRFASGLFGGAPIVNTGGVLGDIWSPKQRGLAMIAYSMSVNGGPLMGPVISTLVSERWGWRWTQYITGYIMLFSLVLDLLFLDETHHGAILVHKARKLRAETGDWSLHAKHEEIGFSFIDILQKYLLKPYRMFVTPICFCFALYASFVYGILYLNFSSFPIVFQDERGWSPVIGSLPFLAMFIGIIGGSVVNISFQGYYMRRLMANGGKPVPEARLPPMMIGSFFFAAGLFIFGWTAGKEYHWTGPCTGATFLGLGFFTIFISSMNYLIDTFKMHAASAIAANTFLRSIFGAAFPLFGGLLFKELGINYASTALGIFAFLLIPIPFVFFKYGARMRQFNRWSEEKPGFL